MSGIRRRAPVASLPLRIALATCCGVLFVGNAQAQRLNGPGFVPFDQPASIESAGYPVSQQPVWQFVPPSEGGAGYLRTNTGELFRIVPVASAMQEGMQPMPMDGTPMTPEIAEHVNAAAEAGGAVGGASGGGDGGSDNGTNPAQNSTTAIFVNSYYSLDGPNDVNVSYLRLKFPMFEKRGALLVEIPFNYLDFETPLSGQIGGLGDVKFQFSGNVWTSCDKRLTMISFLELYVPSADNAVLNRVPDTNEFVALDIGSGKYVVGPGLGLVWALRPNTIIAPLYFYEASVTGYESRPDINRGKWRIFMMNAWQNGMYVLPELNIVTNYHDGSTDAFFAPEVGISKKGTTFYVKPGIGIDPQENQREWGLEFGARISF